MSVFALSSDNQGDSLTVGVVVADMLTWGRQNYLGSKSSSNQKCYRCSEIWGRPDQLRSGISSMHCPKHILVFFSELHS